MLKSSASLLLGALFVLIGALNIWLILQASARVKNARASARLVMAHRVGGYVFIMIYFVMTYFMLERMRQGTGNLSSGSTIHMTVAMLLSPLLFVKVLIARYYKSYYNFLLPIGVLIFVLAFVLVAIAAGPYVFRNSDIRNVSFEEINLTNATVDVVQAGATMQSRCVTCHNLDRVVGARKDARGWLSTVNRMRAMPASGISEDDVKTIVLFLASQNPPGKTGPEAKFAVARALVAQRCATCHSLDRVYKAGKTPNEWRDTVAEMIANAQSDGNAGAFQPGEDKQIVEFLAATQTPEAVAQRKAQAVSAASAGVSVVIPKVARLDSSSPKKRSDVGVVAMLGVGCVGMMFLMVRRPGKIPVPTPAAQPVAEPSTLTPTQSTTPMVLRLVRVTPQTNDSRTLRFALTEGRRLSARPGQFMTFSFLFDGRKVNRSYSICSSPATAGYVEITPKRVPDGCASVFLNDRATSGLTVEASGPYGRFCFDETRHRNIVLIAAGSGITPIMAMLRYIDDLCLGTPVLLLYSVRTENDIIFENELMELNARMKNFQYQVICSQPSEGWTGPRGRMDRAFIAPIIGDIAQKDFFLCGPAAFMTVVHYILENLQVPAEHIHQESFGPGSQPAAPTGTGTPPPPPEAGVATTVEFARSSKTCSIQPGKTLLEVAAENGVAIPSACRQGQCGTCQTRLLSGRVAMDAENGLPPEAKAQGFVLTCVGRACGPVKLDA